MARNVDERIVEMQFNNKQFESGVKESIDSLDKLKQSLDLEGAAKSFSTLDNAARKVNFNPLQNGIEVVTHKLSALEIVGITALQRITNQAMATGERLIKSFTIDPVMSGWNKYEQKVESVQKILNSSADNTMPKVEAALEKIGWFTDETSYQFDAMVSTLGSFSAAGIELEDATNTIIGLANAAAISGVNAENASHGFLGFQRAIGSGYLSLGIWNSYLKTAGFQSQAFIDGCIKAAEELGELKKGLDGVYRTAKGSEVTLATFGETLQEKWVNKDVIKKMAQNFSVASDQLYAVKDNYDMITDAVKDLGDQLDQYSLKAFLAGQETKTWGDAVEYVKGTVAQGWSKTWEMVFGNYEEAKEFYGTIVEQLYELFVVSGNTRNEVLGMWRALGGAAVFRKALINLMNIVIKVVDTVRKAFTQLFPIFDDNEGMAKFLNKLSLRFEHLTKIALKAFDKIEEATKPAREGLGKLAEGIKKANDAGQQTAKVLESISEMAKRVITGEFGNGETRIKQLKELGYCYEEVQNTVNELMGSSHRYTDEQIKASKAAMGLTEENEGLSESAKHVAVQIDRVYTTFDNLVSTFRGVIAVYQIVVNLFQAIVRVGSELINPLGKISDGFLGITGSLGDALVKLKDWLIETDFFYENLKKVSDFISTTFAPAFDAIGDILDKFKNRDFKSVVDWFKQLVDSIKSIFNKDVEKTVTNFGVGFGNIHASIKPVVDVTGALNKQLKDTTEKTSLLGSILSMLSSVFSIVKSAIKGMGTAISQFLGPAMGGAADILGSVATFFQEFINKKWGSVVFNFKDGIRKFFVEILGGIPILSNFKDVLSTITKTNVFKQLFKTITGVEFSFSNLIEVLKDKLEEMKDLFKYGSFNFIDPVKDFFLGFGEALGFGVDQIKKVLGKISFGKIFATAGLGAMIYFVIQISRLAGSIPSFLDSIGGVVKGFKDMMKVSTFKTKMQAVSMVVLSFAALVVSLAWAISKLAEIRDGRAVWRAFGVISLTLLEIGIMLGTMLALTRYANSANIAVIAGALLATGVVIAILMSLMDKILSMEFDKYLEALGRLGILVLGLAGTIFLLRKALGKGTIDIASMGALLLFVIAIKTVIDSILTLSKEEDLDKVKKAMKVYMEILGSLGILAFALKGVSFSGAAGLPLLVISIKMFVDLIKNLAKEDYRMLYSTLLKMVPLFLAILTLISFSAMVGENGYQFAAVMVTIGIMFKAVASAIKTVAKLKPDELTGAVISLTVMAVVIGAMMYAITQFSKTKLTKNKLNQYSVMAVALGITLLAVATALKMLVGLDFGQLMGAAFALGLTILAVGGALALIKKAKFDVTSAIAMSIVIGVVAGALLIMSYLINDIPKALTAAVMLTAVIAAVGFALRGITQIDFGSALSSAIAMSLVLLAATGAFYYLLQQDMDAVQSAALSLSAVLLSVAAAIFILQSVPWEAALAVGVKISAVIGMIGLLMIAVGELYDGFIVNEEQYKRGLRLFVESFTALGEALGGVVSGFIEGLTSKLPQAGKNLSDFSDNVKKFVGTFSDKSVSWTTLAESALSLSNAIGYLKRINVSPTEADNLREGMGYLAQGLNRFYLYINAANLDPAKTKDAADSVEILSGVLRNKEKIDPKIWENLSAGLDALGNALVNFSGIVTGKDTIDEGAINKAIRVVKSLGRAATEIGDLGDFSGWGRLLQFSNEVDAEGKPDLSGLTKLAEAIVAFNAAIKPAISGDDGALDASYLTTAIGAVKDLVTIAGDVPNAGGQLAEWFGGFQGWTTISTDLETLGDALVKFADKTKDLKTDDMNNGFDAVRDLNSLAHELDDPFTGGLVQDILGDNTLGGLATALNTLTPQLKEFASFTRGMDPKETNKAFTILNKIIKIAQDFEMTESFLSIGDQLINFSADFKTAYDTLASVNDENDVIGDLLDGFADLFNEDRMAQLTELGTQMSTAVSTGFSKESTVVATAVSTVISYYETAFVDRYSRFIEAGKELTRQIAGGFSSSDAQSSTDAAVDDISSSMVARTRTWYGNQWSGMYGAGAYLIGGLIAGMESRKSEAVTFAGDLAGDINSKFTTVQKERSPSRVWFGFGNYMIQGLINGIEQSAPTAVNQVQALAEAMNGIFDDTINLDAQAEGITPVYQSSLDSLSTGSMVRRAAGISSTRDYSAAMVAAAGNGTFTIQNLTVNGTENMDVNELSDAVIDKLNRQIASENSRWAY